MILKHMIFYTVVGSVLWGIGSRLGASFAINMFLSLLVPPAILLGYTIYKHRGGQL